MELKNFNIDNFESKPGFKKVETAFQKRVETYEKMNQRPEIKEVLKETIDDIFEKEAKKIISAPQNIFDEAVASHGFQEKKDLEHLVNVAFNKSIEEAIGLSRKTSNLYMMDQLHDMLVDHFYELLVSKNKIKK